MRQIGIPITLVVTPEYKDQAEAVLMSMAVNIGKWESGEQPLIYKMGQHLTSRVTLKIE